jgi:hypothetical protein
MHNTLACLGHRATPLLACFAAECVLASLALRFTGVQTPALAAVGPATGSPVGPSGAKSYRCIKGYMANGTAINTVQVCCTQETPDGGCTCVPAAYACAVTALQLHEAESMHAKLAQLDICYPTAGRHCDVALCAAGFCLPALFAFWAVS